MKNLKYAYIILLVLCITFSNVYLVEALPYYDLKFEMMSENIVKGEFEKIGDDIIVTENKEMTLILDRAYKPIIDIDINKDEEDAIGYSLGAKWNEEAIISKEEEVRLNTNNDSYIMVRPVYKEIKGVIIKDYKSWENKKEITIKIPVDMEYTVKNVE
ncbi:MAG: hypothetical protein ACRC3Y_02150 [Romboutsia sp.]|uniref:hypothetical protein n=1 Tax=Romboutsia sp. TaxID=1965302 RepID=UPI003F3E4E44